MSDLMQDNFAFLLVFLSQILVISVYLPLRRYSLQQEVFDTYPPSEYPKYYPRGIEFERKRQVKGRNIPLLIALVGIMVFCVAWASDYSQVMMTRVVFAFCVVQLFPVVLWGLWEAQRPYQMQAKDQSTTRKAQLHVRHLFDFVSPLSVGIAVATYGLASFALGYIYFNDLWAVEVRWKLPALLAINALMVVGFGGLGVFHTMYGKRIDPHLTNVDRMRRIASGIKIMVLMSIAYSMFILLLVILQSADMVLELNAVFTSIFYQCVIVYGVVLSGRDRNFDVYREVTQ
jgi:hypothetical protein